MSHRPCCLPPIVTLVLVASACAAPPGDATEHRDPEMLEPTSGRVVEDPVAEGLLPDVWRDEDMPSERPRVVEVGPVDVVDAEDDVRGRLVVHEDARELVDIPETELDLIDFETGLRYEVSLAPDLVNALAPQRVDEHADDAVASGDDVAIDKSVTGGKDTRVRLGIADGQGVDGWLSAVGLLTTGCTGTLVDSDTVVTAAHCIYGSSGRVVRPRFIPRADATTSDTAHFGTWSSVKAVAPKAYAANRCNTEYLASCAKYDVAVLKVKRPATTVAAAHAYTFEPRYEAYAQLSKRSLKNRGYPGCAEDDAPAGCVDDTLYGDVKSCVLGREPSVDAPAVVHGCDTSPGHSGSPMFYYRSKGRPVLVGVHVMSESFASFTMPNTLRRFTQNTMVWLSGLL